MDFVERKVVEIFLNSRHFQVLFAEDLSCLQEKCFVGASLLLFGSYFLFFVETCLFVCASHTPQCAH